MDAELQKANMWKRISAYLLDVILLGMLAVGAAFLLSSLLDYDSRIAALEDVYARYESEYGMVFDLSAAEYEALPQEERAVYDAALQAFSEDSEAEYLYSMLINLTLIIITFGLLLAYLLLEFFVPLLLGNGQTLGKKVFGIAVMRVDSVKISPVLLFIRTVLGKYTLETMIPVMLILMIFFGVIGIGGTAVICAVLTVQAILLVVTRTRSPIHDLLAQTVTVDIASQMIFESSEAKAAYLTASEAKAPTGQDA